MSYGYASQLKVGQAIVFYDHSTDQWYKEAIVTAKDDIRQMLSVKYDKGQREATLDYYTVPYRTFTKLVTWEDHITMVCEKTLEIINLKTLSLPLPKGLWAETHDLIYSMCIQRMPFNFSQKLHAQTAQFPAVIYRTLSATPPSASDPPEKSLLMFLARLEMMPSPDLVAREVDRLYNYINRYYVRNHDDVDTIHENVRRGWALMDWPGIVEKIIEPCKQVMRQNPTLVHRTVSRLNEFLPPSAKSAREELERLEKAAMTVIIRSSANLYSQRNGIGTVPNGVCGLITEFAVGLSQSE